MDCWVGERIKVDTCVILGRGGYGPDGCEQRALAEMQAYSFGYGCECHRGPSEQFSWTVHGIKIHANPRAICLTIKRGFILGHDLVLIGRCCFSCERSTCAGKRELVS